MEKEKSFNYIGGGICVAAILIEGFLYILFGLNAIAYKDMAILPLGLSFLCFPINCIIGLPAIAYKLKNYREGLYSPQFYLYTWLILMGINFLGFIFILFL